MPTTFSTMLALAAAIGKIAMNFSDLEHSVDRFIRRLTGLEPVRPVIDSATLSFEQKVRLLAHIVSELKGLIAHPSFPKEIVEQTQVRSATNVHDFTDY